MTDIKLDLSGLSASDLDGLVGLFRPATEMGNADVVAWVGQVLDAIGDELVCRETGVDCRPRRIELGLTDTELCFIAWMVTSVVDAGSDALGELCERMCIGIAGELNRRGKQYQLN